MHRVQTSSPLLLAGIATGLAIVLFFEWHTDEPLVVLPVLLLISFAGGWIAPRHWVMVGITFGWAIVAAHALSTATGLLIPRYQKLPPSTGDWIAMALLVLPSLAAAFGGTKMAALTGRANAS